MNRDHSVVFEIASRSCILDSFVHYDGYSISSILHFFDAGVQPRWIQGDSKVGTELASLEKYIFNYRYRERLETDSVVGRLVEKKRLNNLDYVEQHPCSRWEFSQKNEKQERVTWGYQSFWKLIRFLYFGVSLYTFCYT